MLRRWVRENRGLVGTSAAALAAVVVAVVVAFFNITAAKNSAHRERDRAEAINKFLVEDLLAAARPEELGKDVPMRKVVDEAARQSGEVVG